MFVFAAIGHVVFVMAIYFAGRFHVLPHTFDTNGIGVSFAIDSHDYRIEAENMAQLIKQFRFLDWATYRASFHVKPYSLSFALLGRLVGYNILAVEPVNLAYFLSMLWLVYSIAREAFDRNVARLAIFFIGLWPSLLLHTTQMLRDAVFIPSMLLLVLALLLCATRPLSLKQASLVALAGSIALLLVWLCRGDMRELVVAIVLIGAVIATLAQLKERRFRAGKTAAIVWLVFMTILIPRSVPAHRQSDESLLLPRPSSASGRVAGNNSAVGNGNLFEAKETDAHSSKLARRVGLLRHKFIISYPLAGSNIDAGVELVSTADVVRYFPRAALIGFLSPFPNMWYVQGAQVGLAGRLVAGAEMLIMYLMLAFMVFAMTREWKHLSVWLLFATASLGCIALGYVVINISALYRMRYVFFILLIILGVKGLLLILSARTRSQTLAE